MARKKQGQSKVTRGPTLLRGRPRGLAPAVAEPLPSRPSLAELTQRLLLKDYTPASVLINRKYEILYFHGPTADYLHLPRGEPTQNLMLMARTVH